MPTLVELLTPLVPRIEAEIQPRLQGFLGGFIRAYLPQQWVFRTERESATVRIEANGKVIVARGTVSAPDVRVDAPHEALEQVLATNGHSPAADRIHVSGLTAKGRVAVEQLRGRFGV